MAYYKKTMENTPVGDITIYAQDDYITKYHLANKN